jgi:peptidyl-prolyl cis-trans isomerase D
MAARDKTEETGVIQKIQRQTGCLLLIIGAAMLAFVLTDLFKSGPSAFSGSQNLVGEIAGEDIDINEFQSRVEERRNLYLANNPEATPDEETLREEAWNMLINDKIIKREHAKLGLVVSPDEFEDVTVGNQTHPRIVQAFQNPETGQYDKARFIQFLEVDIQDDEDLKQRWLLFFEDPIKEEIVGSKYDKLVKSGLYTTTLDAQNAFDENTLTISAAGVGLPYAGISDSTIKVTDKALKSYMNSHRDEFQQDASRALQFTIINVIPSSDDSARVKKWAMDYVDRFKAAKDDSSFVAVHRSQTPFNPEFVGRGSFDKEVEEQLFSADSGTVIGPVYANGVYSLYKLAGISQDSIASIRARHILVPILGSTLADTAEAMANANKLLSEIRSGAKKFEDETVNNFDGSGNKGGDLGWIKEEGFSRVSDDLRKEIFRRGQGSMFVFKSVNGIHIVDVTSGRSSKTIQVAVLDRVITPGNETDREAERLAAEIQYQLNNGADFAEEVEKRGLTVREAGKVMVEDQTIPGIQNPSLIMRWLFEEGTKKGDISEVYDINDKYIIAQCTKVMQEGLMDLEDGREFVTASYVNDEKSKILIKEMESAMSKAKNVEDLATALSTSVRPIPAQTFASSSVAGIGIEPKVLGTLFGLEESKFSKPIKGASGVYVVMVNGKVPSEATFDAKVEKERVTSQIVLSADGRILDALQKAANIKDNRYKFF